MAAFQLINQTKNYLRGHVEGAWFQTYRIKEQGTDVFLHDLNGLQMIVRVNYPDMFGFYWFYQMSDVYLLIKYVNEQLKLEAHEIIVNPTIKVFYDIDMTLTESDLSRLIDYYSEYSGEYDLDINDVARHLANLYFDASLASLVEHGNDSDKLIAVADMMYTSRNRPLDQTGHKLSIHVITNIACTIEQCKALVEDVQRNILHHPDDYNLDYDPDSYELITKAIDVQPYHRLGSLAITGGQKIVNGIEYVNQLQQSFQLITEEPFITRIDSVSNKISFAQYKVAPSYQGPLGADVSKEFISLVYQHAHKIPYFNANDWDLESASHKGNVAIIRRMHPSWCSICERQHDLDNTLMIVFNEERGTGSWKCLRSRDVKAQVFFRDEPDNDAELDAFASQTKAFPCILMPKHDTTDSDEPLTFSEPYSDEAEEIPIIVTPTIIEGPVVDDLDELTDESYVEDELNQDTINQGVVESSELDPSRPETPLAERAHERWSDSDVSDCEDESYIDSDTECEVEAPSNIVDAPDDRLTKIKMDSYEDSESEPDDSESDEESDYDSDPEIQLDADGYESDGAKPIEKKDTSAYSNASLSHNGSLHYSIKNKFIL
jgi:hypothetical protein